MRARRMKYKYIYVLSRAREARDLLPLIFVFLYADYVGFTCNLNVFVFRWAGCPLTLIRIDFVSSFFCLSGA